MYADIQKLLQDQADLLCAGKFEELAQLYQLPFVAYHDGVPTYLEDRDRAIEVLTEIAATMAARGSERLHLEVTSVELANNGRFKVWSRCHEINGEDKVLSKMDVLYYFNERAEGPFVQMIEIRACSTTH